MVAKHVEKVVTDVERRSRRKKRRLVVLEERKSTHGDFAECARISQGIMRLLRSGPRFSELSDAQVEALQMVAHKMHRIVCGDPDHEDHWRDGAGYLELGREDVERRRGRG